MNDEKKRSTEIVSKVTGVLLFLFSVICLFIVKYKNPDFKLWVVIVIGVIILVLSLFIFFSSKLLSKIVGDRRENSIEKAIKKPEPRSMKQLEEYVHKYSVKNKQYMNEIEKWENHRTQTVGEINKSTVYIADVILKYPRSDSKKDREAYIILNAHYPERGASLIMKKDKAYLHSAINSAGDNVDDKKEVEETRSINNLSGTEIVTKKIRPHLRKDWEKKEESKKGELQ